MSKREQLQTHPVSGYSRLLLGEQTPVSTTQLRTKTLGFPRFIDLTIHKQLMTFSFPRVLYYCTILIF